MGSDCYAAIYTHEDRMGSATQLLQIKRLPSNRIEL